MTDITRLKLDFIRDAQPILQYVIAKAKGDPPESLPLMQGLVDEKSITRVWDLLEPMLLGAADVKKLEAKNASDVLRLLGNGKISVAEAKDLLELFHKQMEIEEVPKLVEALEKSND